MKNRIALEVVEMAMLEWGIDRVLSIGDIRLFYRLASALAPGSKILEIGTSQGRSTRIFSMAAPDSTILTVDVRDCWNGLQNENIIRLIMDSKYVAAAIRGAFDLVFIDGAHDEASAARDISMCAPLVAVGGVFMFHDYSKDWPGVVAAVDKWMQGNAGYQRIETVHGEETTVSFAVRKI